MLGALAVRTVHTTIVGAGAPFLEAAHGAVNGARPAGTKTPRHLGDPEPPRPRRRDCEPPDESGDLRCGRCSALAAEAIDLLFERYEG